jgi:NAD+ diphosphatase
MPKEFRPARGIPAVPPSTAEWLVLRDRDLLVAASDGCRLPRDACGLAPTALQHLGCLGDLPVMAAAIAPGTPAPEGWDWVGLRHLLGVLDDAWLSVAARAAQLLDWELCHAFCGRCGASTALCEEGCRVCSRCQFAVYPRIEPAVIVAITRPPRQILLAHSSRLPEGVYSNLAGFLEVGETLEQCVEREVFEEAGIHVKNIRYAGSQPWPFPRSLMVGFLAEYDHGDITIDPKEIERADWFSLDALPRLPAALSIARWLIERAAAELGQ